MLRRQPGNAGVFDLYPTKFPAEFITETPDFTPPKMLSAGTPELTPTKRAF